jgi:hypothetical protein
MRRPVEVKAHFRFLLSVSLFPFSQAASVAILPSALFCERYSLGARWMFSGKRNRTNTDQGFHMAYRSLVVRGDSSILARHCRYKCETRKNEAAMVTASSSRAIYRSRVPRAFTRPVRAW